MTQVRTMLSLAGDYLAERRRLGFDRKIQGSQIIAFARFVDGTGHTGPLTTRIVLDWAQGQAKHAVRFTWARQLEVLRPFARYLTRLGPATEFPKTAIYGRAHDLDNAMAALSTYVGHIKVFDTYWYLTAVPDLMAVTGSRCEDFTAKLGQDRHE